MFLFLSLQIIVFLSSMMPFFDSCLRIFNFLSSHISYCDIGPHFSLLLLLCVF